MPKDEWVAVAPEFSGGSSSGAPSSNANIRKPSSAYQIFQKEASAELRAAGGNQQPFDIASHSRAIRDRWHALSEQERERYEDLARQDASRYAQESHAADLAAIERRERLRRERETLLLDDEGGTRRTTRHAHEKKLRKKAKIEAKREKKKRHRIGDEDEDDEDFQGPVDAEEEEWDVEKEDDDDDDDDEDNDDSDDEEDSDGAPRKSKNAKPKKATPPRKISQKQAERKAEVQQEKAAKEEYITHRQEDLRKERANQAKRRLEFLLKQSNIFSHFGRVKEDTAKYGIQQKPSTAGAKSRRGSAEEAKDDADDPEELEEADEHHATYLTSQPTTLGFGTMRAYQLEGLNWMIRLQENGVNGILADEMGLGKTLQSISVLVYMLEYQAVSGPHLVVVPKSTLSNWINEFAKWAPTLNVVKFHGDKETREEITKKRLEPAQRDEDRDWNVLVTTYEVCNIERNILKKFAWSYLIIDEAHRLKNEASSFSRTVRSFETRYRILLTGTPLQNSLHELWALLNFLVPDVFESSEQFDEWFNLDIEDNDEKNKLISQLHKILRPFMLRRLKADVETSLPPKHETILFTGMSAMQKKLYRDILTRDINAIHGNSGNRAAILNIVMQLRKCAGHPYLFPGIEDRTLPPLGEHLVENSGKMVVLDKLLMRLRERGHRVLLFTQMTRILDIMEDYLVMRRFPYCRIDGNTSYEDREAYIDAYNAPNSEKFLFLLSTRAGGLGINLQTADVVILFDSDWNPQADLQAQDRAHRIGQKKPVQVFRLVTEHTIEEKIVERAQQKLKLDAMVVQQGRLKERDKLSRDELLAAVRFGADKIFKSKDSSITDDDIDMILDAGKRKTEQLNEKLQAADKGDLLDFKLDGSSAQTFEGVDYSNNAVFAQAKAEAEMMGIFDIGKRERRNATYNENSLYQQQMAAMQGGDKRKNKKRKEIRLPKYLRLPRMEEWQMYDREALFKIQEEEEIAFKSLPEETQKMATSKSKGTDTTSTPSSEHAATKAEGIDTGENETEGEAPRSSDEHPEADTPFELPPLISEARQAEKEKLLSEGFASWSRQDYMAFTKASARHGRKEISKIAVDVGKPETVVREYANAFWGDIGKARISEHEYDRVVKLIERGEKKIEEIKGLERGTRILVSLFDNPWEELEFSYVNCRDKMFTIEEDRHLLCWTRKYGYGQWLAIKFAVRRSPNFRFDYFLRSLPVDLLGRRCEQLMKAAEKEVEQLERKAREQAGLKVEPDQEGEELPPIQLPKFRILRREKKRAEKLEMERDRKHLEDKVAELEAQIAETQSRLKVLTEGHGIPRSLSEASAQSKVKKPLGAEKTYEAGSAMETDGADPQDNYSDSGANGPDGTFVAFPEYDGSREPEEWKKPFTHFCIRTRKEVKASLGARERKDKQVVNGILKERWLQMSEDEKGVWRGWTEWDKKRYARDLAIYQSKGTNDGEHDEVSGFEMEKVHIPKKKRKQSEDEMLSIPKKKR